MPTAVGGANSRSSDRAEQLRLQDEFTLLVLLIRFICLVILPADRLFALPAMNVTHDVPACGHVALIRLRLGHIDDAIEQICLSMLAPEVLLQVSCRVSNVRVKR